MAGVASYKVACRGPMHVGRLGARQGACACMAGRPASRGSAVVAADSRACMGGLLGSRQPPEQDQLSPPGQRGLGAAADSARAGGPGGSRRRSSQGAATTAAVTVRARAWARPMRTLSVAARVCRRTALHAVRRAACCANPRLMRAGPPLPLPLGQAGAEVAFMSVTWPGNLKLTGQCGRARSVFVRRHPVGAADVAGALGGL